MSETLKIENFGPIKSVSLALGKMTVLIGEQASGKSTIAKVLSICRYFSYIVNYSDSENEFSEFTENNQFKNGLEEWGLDEYLKKETKIFYENHLYTFESEADLHTKIDTITEKSGIVSKTKITPISDAFKQLLNQLVSLRNDEVGKNKNSVEWLFWTPNENFFRLNVKKVMDNPLFIPTERGFQSLSVNKDSLVSNAILDELAKINRIVRGTKNEVEIKPLDLTFRVEDQLGKVRKTNEEEFYFLHKGASGYQSSIPIVLAIKYYNEIEKRKRTFIVEEPEINLFPTSQKKLMHFFIESINNHKHSFVIPTHSPYFLSVINDLILAYKRGKKNEEQVKKIVEKSMWLNPDDVNVYELKNGKASEIFDINTGMISDNIIDDVSDEMNEEFEKLLNTK